MGKPGYQVMSGEVLLDGTDVLKLAPWERAVAGLFLAMQYPIEVPGVSLSSVMRAALTARASSIVDLDERLGAEADRIGFDRTFLSRPLNVDLSGGEKKRNETLQMSVLAPRFAILDELDSGLDLDALRACSRRVEAATHENGLGVLAITHYTRLLTELHPDRVHILVKGQIVESGGPELADDLEEAGYARWVGSDDPPASPAGPGPLDDLFAL
jgi:Fe-S cluster assembly ATP-binding protein